MQRCTRFLFVATVLASGVSTPTIARAGCAQWDVFPGAFDKQTVSFGVYAGELYIGGAFENVGGQPCGAIARWDGAQFRRLVPGGLIYNFGTLRCNAILELDGELLAGGSFAHTAGGGGGRNIAKWTLSSWWPVGDPSYFFNEVNDLRLVQENGEETLYAASNGLHRWTDAAWESADLSGRVETVEVFDDGSGPTLYASRHLSGSGFLVDRRDPVTGVWSTIGEFDDRVEDLAVWDDGSGPALFACGQFTTVGAMEARRIVKWDGSSWLPLGTGFNNDAYSMVVWDDGSGERLWVGGTFTIANGNAVSRVAAWDGTTFEGLDATINKTVSYILPFDDGTGPALWLAGLFTLVNGEPTSYAARYRPCAVLLCPGDTNGDNLVNFQDLNTVLNAYSSVEGDPNYNPAADLDGDDDVDFADLNVVVSAFNSAC